MKHIVMGITLIVCLGLQWACTGTGRTGDDQRQSLGQQVQEAEMISPEGLQAILSDPEVLVIDLRTPRDWKQSDSKIPGAVRYDPQDLESWAQDLDKGQKIVTYCA